MARRFETEGELRRAIEVLLCYDLSNTTWKAMRPRWQPPYDSFDMKEIMRKRGLVSARRGKNRQECLVQ